MVDTSYTAGIYTEQGANRMVVKSGASLDIESGGEIDVESGASLKLAGTALTPTAAQINALTAAGYAADGLLPFRVARATYDFAVKGGAQGTISLGVTIPQYAIVCGGFVQVNTLLTAGGGGTGALQALAANDLITATVVAGAPWSSIGLKAITPKANTPESTGIYMSAAGAISFVIATADVTAGKFTVFVYYVQGAAQA